MFTFEEQFKKQKQLFERSAEAYDFWINCLFSSFKEFFKK
jgi:hypothetical protein